ncbi:SGNH/GDSL hydrolase family protein [Chroococcus sp. FPU101]|uniref:SGNH/GDSL hydrolase family protein n=1 Tax=Chroococcus sp. FPU101 TaxID=1974212 RepID=UPI001A8DED48|nr:SGNH/GDSL hydrolase family protein [Chroococcus sp. FPU101]GFE67770.1 lipolytic protein [Chroococcus sp. FPU101]
MNKQLLTTGFLVLSTLAPFDAQAANFTGIYAFGDSLTDTGNVFNLSGQPTDPYFNGRASNGQLWIEYLADKLNLPIQPSTPSGTNFAFIGATTGFDNTVNPALPGLQQEVLGYLNNNPTADPDALYVVWAGANDYLPTESTTFTPYTEPTTTVNNLASVVTALATVGAKNILVANLPDLGELPRTNTTSDANRLNDLTQAHNTLLSQTLSSLLLPADVEITTLDVNTLFDNVVNNPARFNFTNVTDRCLTFIDPTNFDICSNPNEYLFWDQIHPTTAGHRLIGNLAAQTLGVPEPSFVPGVAIIGIWGVSQIVRFSKQKSSK